MSAGIPSVALGDGHEIPQLGLGLYKVRGDDVARVVGAALELGYRHFDTATLYENEPEVGAALAAGGVSREELFVTTKLWYTDLARDDARAAFSRSLEALGLDYLDLYLIHWPAPRRGLYVEAWRALQELRAEGLVRSIGVSNFTVEHLTALLDDGGAVPVLNQIELHPLFQQPELRAWMARHDIRTEAWGPLGQGKYDLGALGPLATVAARHGVTAQETVLAWQLREGTILIPKSSRPERLAANLAAFRVPLDDDDLRALRALDQGRRLGAHPDERN